MPGRQTTGRSETGTLLEVTDLITHFQTPRGLVRAVDGVSFTLERGRTLGIVGESGSGKTVLSRSIMGLLGGKSLVRDGTVRFEGQELIGLSAKQMRHIWGQEMAMIFQDPMTSLNPLMKIGDQIAEPLRIHLDMIAKTAAATAERLLPRRAHPGGGATPRAVPARDVGRHAPAGDDRHRPGVRPDAAVRRRAHHRARRHRAGADPRPDRRAATGTQHVADARHPRPRGRGRPHRRDRRDVRRQARREGTDDDAVRQHEDAVHRGAVAEHPEARGSVAHPAAHDPRPAARPRQPAAGLPVRAPLPVRAGSLPRGTTAAGAGRHSRPPVRLLVPGRLARIPARAQGRSAGTTSSTVGLAEVVVWRAPARPTCATRDDVAAARRGSRRRVPGRAHRTDRQRGRRASASTSARARRSASSASPAAASRTTGRAIMQLPRPTAGSVRVRGQRADRRWTATTMRAGPHADADDLPGPDLVAQPAPQGARHRDGAAEHLEARHERSERTRVVDGTLEEVGIDPTRAAESQAAPVLRRPVPAHLHRPVARARSDV